MTAGAILDFTHRSGLVRKVVLGLAALGISCVIVAAAFAQNVTLTNLETNNSAPSSADPSEVSGRQGLLGRVYFTLAVGYENSSYFSTLDGVDATREDNYFFVQPALDLTLTRYGSVGACYLHRQNRTIL